MHSGAPFGRENQPPRSLDRKPFGSPGRWLSRWTGLDYDLPFPLWFALPCFSLFSNLDNECDIKYKFEIKDTYPQNRLLRQPGDEPQVIPFFGSFSSPLSPTIVIFIITLFDILLINTSTHEHFRKFKDEIDQIVAAA